MLWRRRVHRPRPERSEEECFSTCSHAAHEQCEKAGRRTGLVRFGVAQSTVARYMCRRWRPPSQGWRTFLRNHADGIAAVDLFVLPTIAFRILYCLVIIRHEI